MKWGADVKQIKDIFQEIQKFGIPFRIKTDPDAKYFNTG